MIKQTAQIRDRVGRRLGHADQSARGPGSSGKLCATKVFGIEFAQTVLPDRNLLDRNPLGRREPMTVLAGHPEYVFVGITRKCAGVLCS